MRKEDMSHATLTCLAVCIIHVSCDTDSHVDLSIASTMCSSPAAVWSDCLQVPNMQMHFDVSTIAALFPYNFLCALG